MFEILVGPSEEPLYAHANALSKSIVLEKEVEGLWKEKSERKIYWPDWSVNAADKFLEWLYTADYTCPYPIEPKQDREVPGDGSAVVHSPSVDAPFDSSDGNMDRGYRSDGNDMGFGDTSVSRWETELTVPESVAIEVEPDVTERSTTLLALQDLNWVGYRPLDKRSQAEEYEKWTGRMQSAPAELDYEPTFMTHAEVYVMACRYLVDDLKSMAWQRLRSVLISIGRPQTGSPVVGNLVTLIHYVYRETGQLDVNLDEEPLRRLVVTYMASYFRQLKGSAVDDLVTSKADSDREFVVDFMDTILNEIESVESRFAPIAPWTNRRKKGKR